AVAGSAAAAWRAAGVRLVFMWTPCGRVDRAKKLAQHLSFFAPTVPARTGQFCDFGICATRRHAVAARLRAAGPVSSRLDPQRETCPMSYDLMVFDPAGAPGKRAAFLDWYDEQTEWPD